jgi:hypothetical protein
MSKPFKVLLALEALVCFGPAAIFLPIGVMMVPMRCREKKPGKLSSAALPRKLCGA